MLRIVLMVVMSFFIFVSSVKARPICGKRNEALLQLEKGYSEVPIGIGLSSSGSVVELFAANDGGFTIIMTQPNGISCSLVYGKSWENLPIKQIDKKT